MRQKRQFLAFLREATVVRMRSFANIRLLKFMTKFGLNPGTKLRDRALLRMAERF